MNLAALLMQLPEREKQREAVRLLERAAPLAPKDEWRPTYNLALARTRLGERGDALALTREVLARWPNHAGAQKQARVLEANLLEAKQPRAPGRSSDLSRGAQRGQSLGRES